jgi:2,5-diketo-D-gluconate reductase A
MADQPHVELNDGRRMPQFGLGVWRTPADDAAQVVRTALDAGYQAVDTAAIYGNEEGVGEAIEGREVFLTTKLWNADQGFDSALRAFDASAKKLRRETIDLYLIHWASPERGKYRESWKALCRLKEEGRALSIGVSNFAESHLEEIIDDTGVAPAVNQIELHPDFQQREMRAVNERLGIITESWSPLGQAKALDNPVLKRIGGKYGKSPAQVAIRWHLDLGLIVIPKSVHAERIAQNIDVFDFKLDADDLARIETLDRKDGRLGGDPMTANY